MIPSINLASDSLGLGQMWSGTASAFTSATGTELCGSKPTCISLGRNSNCARKTKAYTECMGNSLRLMETQSNNQAAASMGSNNTRTAVAENQNKMLMYAGIALAVIILLFIIYKVRS